ncbi:steroid Delta-isomerase [Anaerolineae bacterium]|nr:steroid Delta-isomerase [Anaerolineae bacterium]
MNESIARAWLGQLARAWKTQDADAMAELFTDDATDQTDPFKPPVRGKENLRQGFAWWMRDQRDIHITIGQVDVIGNRFYAEIDSSWTVVSSGEKIQERGLLVCDLEENKARTMREFWKTHKG